MQMPRQKNNGEESKIEVFNHAFFWYRKRGFLTLFFHPVYPYSPRMRNGFFASLSLYPWRHLCISLAPLAVSLILLATLIGTGETLVLYFREMRMQDIGLTSAMYFISQTARYFLYAIYAALFINAIYKRDGLQIKRVLVFSIVQICIAALFVQCIKIVVGSPRPLLALDIDNSSRMPFSFSSEYHSFPSGHTTEMTSASATLASWFHSPAFSCVMGILIALMGISRIYLSQHRLSEVAAGMVLGATASLLIHFFCSREYSYDYPFRSLSR